jgi:hypothetical protein
MTAPVPVDPYKATLESIHALLVQVHGWAAKQANEPQCGRGMPERAALLSQVAAQAARLALWASDVEARVYALEHK